MAEGNLYIRAWRKHRGLTQEELAKLAGVDPTQISRVENGKRKYDRQTLEAIAAALDCDPGDLLKTDPKQQGELEAVWDRLSEEERRQLLRHAQVIIDTRKRD